MAPDCDSITFSVIFTVSGCTVCSRKKPSSSHL
jgi:hypothetical protein